MSAYTQSAYAPTMVAVTIPGSATAAGTSLADLLTAGGYTGPVKSVTIDKSAPGTAGTDRSAFLVASRRDGAAAVVATDFTTHGKFVRAGADWAEPTDDPGLLHLRSADASTVSALVTVYRT